MKQLIRAAIGFFLLAAAALPQSSYPELQRLYNQKRYFELRDALEAFAKADSTELLFFQGVVANVFNRLPDAISHLQAYLERVKNKRDSAQAREAYEHLADSFRKSFQYAQAADINERILILYRDRMDAQDTADHENEYRLWNALKDIPPQSVERAAGIELPMERSRIPLEINGHAISLGLDTGADLSVLIRSLAEKFELEIVNVPVKVGSITGEKVDAKVGVASMLKLGDITVRHTLFLVFADEHFYFPEYDYQVEGVLGFPLLAALGELTFVREGRLIIPSSPRPHKIQNLALRGFKPLIEGFYRDQRLTFVLDTGASRTDLWPPFFRLFQKEIEASSPLRTERLRGAGGQRDVKSHTVRDITLRFSGKPAVFRRLPVLIEYTTDDSRHFYGNLGQDLVRQFRRMTINFLSMSVVFE